MTGWAQAAPTGPVTGTAAVVAVPTASEPELREGLEESDVGPGIMGFAIIFALVLACIPLFLSMTGKLRKVDHRARPEDTTPSDGEAGDGEAEEPGAGPEEPGTGDRPAGPNDPTGRR